MDSKEKLFELKHQIEDLLRDYNQLAIDSGVDSKLELFDSSSKENIPWASSSWCGDNMWNSSSDCSD